jgi:hypothetical protein
MNGRPLTSCQAAAKVQSTHGPKQRRLKLMPINWKVLAVGTFTSTSVFCNTRGGGKIDLSSHNKLNELWHEDAIYFVPSDAKSVSWNGVVYQYATKSCHRLVQGKGDVIEASEIKCPNDVAAKATAPYAKISNFKTFQTKFLGCLKPVDEKCLRPMISRTAVFSFGFEGYEDRRDWLFANWSKEDYERLHDLVKKGVTGDKTSKSFPANQKPDDFSHRGEFKLVDGSWLLVSFVEGD